MIQVSQINGKIDDKEHQSLEDQTDGQITEVKKENERVIGEEAPPSFTLQSLSKFANLKVEFTKNLLIPKDLTNIDEDVLEL